ncbi:plasmid mobilization relaxosome protein MobC [Streptomyces sp. B22F1]|uniref:plasmid mobilization relaxosome protein MobC n=1 Tax=Streptomyces sp. B22F1 TaxID=3153566 RepID=UPI00325E4A56
MPDPDQTAARRSNITDPPSNRAARYPAGPSKIGSSGGVSAPGVAETQVRLQGEPDQSGTGGESAGPLPIRAAIAAAVHRAARRRRRDTRQRTRRLTVRFSHAEEAQIKMRARQLNIAVAHLMADATMAVVDDTIPLVGQRTATDDLIDELAALRTAISLVGNNVNQVAKRLNSHGPTHPTDAAVLAAAEQAITLTQAVLETVDSSADQAASSRAR